MFGGLVKQPVHFSLHICPLVTTYLSTCHYISVHFSLHKCPLLGLFFIGKKWLEKRLKNLKNTKEIIAVEAKQHKES
jgi:hypothetical protein